MMSADRRGPRIANAFAIGFALILLGVIGYMLRAALLVLPKSSPAGSDASAVAEVHKVYREMGEEELQLAKLPWSRRATEPAPASVKNASLPWVTQRPNVANITVGLARLPEPFTQSSDKR